jgi:flagellar basal-body rod protein FlgG
MINSFYTAAASVTEMQKGFDVTANNISNVSSSGYKASKATFADLIYTNIKDAQGGNADLKSGHGAKLDKTNIEMSSGEMQQTGLPLDYAILDENGFFAVQKDGRVEYTKNGNFHLTVAQGKNYLTASDGGLVLDSKGQPVTLAGESDSPADIGVYTFQNRGALERIGNCSFLPTGASGTAAAAVNPELKKGWLEGSNVNVADEMASVISLQRAFQMNSKIVQMSDEITQTINSLR